MKEQELLQWLITERANAMQSCREYRKAKDASGALIAGTEASAFALVIKRTKEIFNISSNVPVMRSVCDCGGKVVRYSRVNLICKRCSTMYDGEQTGA